MDSVCDHCGVTFGHRADRSPRYCTMACRRADARQVSNCETCGNRFSRKKSEAGRFCSRACGTGRPRDESKWIEKTCPGCGKIFLTPRYRETDHCSRACRSQATTIEAICPICGDDFAYYRSWPRTHCSSACYGVSREKGGRHYYGPNWQVQRAFAIVRDGGACVDCQSTDSLHVHHLQALRQFDGDWKSANELSNLVTVCSPCHLVRHGGSY